MKDPSFFFERQLWKKGVKYLAGIDEVGRGSFAGPVLAGCVVFAPVKKLKLKTDDPKLKINDSKKLTAKQRERADKWIKDNALVWAVGEAPVSLINRIGLGKATKVAFRRAIAAANNKLYGTIDFCLIDAFYIPFVRGLKRKNQLVIVHGDEKSLTIAAASIIAKVQRDKDMRRLARKFKKYAWDKNKGYGTKKHQRAIYKWGLTRYHRKAFVATFLAKQKT